MLYNEPTYPRPHRSGLWPRPAVVQPRGRRLCLPPATEISTTSARCWAVRTDRPSGVRGRWWFRAFRVIRATVFMRRVGTPGRSVAPARRVPDRPRTGRRTAHRWARVATWRRFPRRRKSRRYTTCPPPPDQPSARKLPVPPPAEGVKPPAAELPPAPLPDDDNRKPSKDQGNTDKPRKPQAQHRLKSRPVTICSASQQPQSGDVVNAKELVVLRQSMSPPSPHATSSATSPAPSATVPASAPSATSAQSSHWQEAVFTWFTSDELLRDGSAGRVPAAHNAASSAGHDVP